MKAYVTSYALTLGILEVEARTLDNCNTMIEYSHRPFYVQYAHAGEWFTSRDEAIADAESQRTKKIASLRRQLAELEGLRFDVVGAQP